MKNVVSVLLLCLIVQHLNAQTNPNLSKQYAEIYPKEDAIIINVLANIEFSYNSASKSIVVDEVFIYKILALKPNSEIQISAFYDDNTALVSYKSNIRLEEKTCGNYHPEGIFHSDLKLCIYTFTFKYAGEENIIIIKFRHNDIHYYSKTLFSNQKYPVINSTISYLVPDGLNIDFINKNTEIYNFKKVITNGKEKKKYDFSCENISKYKDEKDIPPVSYYAPLMAVVPKSYKNGDINMSIFNNLDNLYAWCKDKADQTKNDVQTLKPMVNEIIAGKTTDLGKIKALFYWVQDNIRYIAFEEGMAGYIPECAQDVYAKKFGDCKGMANLLKCMLVEAGYDARLTWLGTNEIKFNYTIPTLISNNHVICTLFFNHNHYFLDATNKYNSFGEFPESISGRQILIENGNKYILDSIPFYRIPVSKVFSEMEYEIDDKMLTGNISIHFDGDLRANMLSRILLNRTDDKDRILGAIITRGVPKVSAKNITSSTLQNRDTTLVLNADLTVKGQVMVYDDDLYINLDPFDDFEKYNTKEDRKIPLFFSSRELRKTTTKLSLPVGYKVKTIPGNYSLKNDYLSIDVKFVQESDHVYYTKEFTVHTNVIPYNFILQWVTDLKHAKKAIAQPFIFTKI